MRGEEAAFTRLVERHASLVLGVACRKLGDEHSANDVAQEVFAILARSASRLLCAEALPAWLHRVTLHRVMKHVSRRQRERVQLGRFLVTQETLPDEGDAFEDLMPQLDEALDSLSGSERRLLLLRYHERLSFAEMAERLHLSEAALRKQASRAVDRLRAWFARRGHSCSAAGVLAALGAALTPTSAVSAAGLAAAALASTTLITTGTLALTSFITMSTTKAITLTAAATFVLMGVPVVLEHQAGNALETRLALAESSAKAAEQEHAEAMKREAKKQRDLESRLAAMKQGLAAAATSTSALTPVQTAPGPVTPLSEQEMEAKMRKFGTLALGHFDAMKVQRISASLGLTPAQEQAYKQFIQKQTQIILDSKLEVGSQAWKDRRVAAKREEETFIASLIGPAKAAQFSMLLQRREQDQIEQASYKALHRFTAALELSDEQKDALFQHFSHQAAQNTGVHTQRSLNLTLAADVSDLPSVNDDTAAQAVLTPEQMKVWKQFRQSEEQFHQSITSQTLEIIQVIAGAAETKTRSTNPPGTKL
jgi:RNA polymerase sigma factor (sigma-70 family)